jgi:Tat protein secretion system quality control protein TatD with DNase activity
MHVMETAKKIAEVKGLPIEEVDRVTSQVTKAFFNL